MSHSRNSQAVRDLRDSRPTQDERDREATDIANELGDDPRDIGAIVKRIDDSDTARVHITSMDARLAELVDEHDSSAPPFPEFARRRTDREYDLDDFRAGLDVTQTDLPVLPDQEPTWWQMLRFAAEDLTKALR